MFSDISDEDEMIKISQDIERNERFPFPMKQCDLDNLVQKALSKKTEEKSKWALNVFTSWQTEREKMSTQNKDIKSFKGDIVHMYKVTYMMHWSFFVAEVRNKSGMEYKPNTLYELVIALQHHMRANKRLISLLDDAEFGGMRCILDAKMKDLSRQGLGINVKKADVIKESQENEMWEKGVLGIDSPKKLLDTLIFVLGLNFALRAAKEHRNLRVGLHGQIQVKTDNSGKKYLQYIEDVSKTNNCGLLHRQKAPKVTRAYENSTFPERCPVAIYEKYISLRQPSNIDDLYLRPKKEIGDVWYCNSPLGVHHLQQTVSRFCQQSGLQGHYTNHSLRATAATRLYNAGVDEQLVAEHISVKATNKCSQSAMFYREVIQTQCLHAQKFLRPNVPLLVP